MSNLTAQNNVHRVMLALEQHQISKYGGCTGCAVPLAANGMTIERHQALTLQSMGLIKPDATGTMDR